MIEITIQEVYENYPIKKIILNDLNTSMERLIWVSSKVTCLDKDDNFIYEEITIINRLNHIGTIAIYAGEKYNLVAYQEISNGRADHYVLIDGKFILMGSDITEYDQNLKGCRTNHFDKNGNFLFIEHPPHK